MSLSARSSTNDKRKYFSEKYSRNKPGFLKQEAQVDEQEPDKLEEVQEK